MVYNWCYMIFGLVWTISMTFRRNKVMVGNCWSHRAGWIVIKYNRGKRCFGKAELMVKGPIWSQFCFWKFLYNCIQYSPCVFTIRMYYRQRVSTFSSLNGLLVLEMISIPMIKNVKSIWYFVLIGIQCKIVDFNVNIFSKTIDVPTCAE